MKKIRDPASPVTHIHISLHGRHQGGQDYPSKEIEKEDTRQKQKEWHMGPKGKQYLVLLFRNVFVLVDFRIFAHTKSILTFSPYILQLSGI